jgi:hypothetical protein
LTTTKTVVQKIKFVFHHFPTFVFFKMIFENKFSIEYNYFSQIWPYRCESLLFCWLLESSLFFTYQSNYFFTKHSHYYLPIPTVEYHRRFNRIRPSDQLVVSSAEIPSDSVDWLNFTRSDGVQYRIDVPGFLSSKKLKII